MCRTVCQPELDYFERNYRDLIAEFRGKWVAVSGSSLVGIGDTLEEALQRAAEAGCRRPVLFYLNPEAWEEPFCGGEC
ncbi:MAG: DUF5678 domain-containing protein [Moorellales bacterium]